jgi:predicted phosphodiesterase
MQRYLFSCDLHYGFERRGGHKLALHDEKAWEVVVKFAQDFKPNIWIHGGDMLDCGMVSHHNNGKPGQTEGMKLLADAEAGRKLFIDPVEEICTGEKIYVTGNHEDFLEQMVDLLPTLEGIIDLKPLLKLDKWRIIPSGGVFNLGKLTFLHGDTISGGEHMAKNAVINYERSVRFGHFHTFQAFSKNCPIEYKYAKTGIAVPCLCGKSPNYIAGRPNKWIQGFSYGYVDDKGCFNDYFPIILDGKTVINGKIYKA